MCSFKALGHCTLEVFGSREGEKTGGCSRHLSLWHIEFESSWMAGVGGYLENGCASGDAMEPGPQEGRRLL